MFFVLFVSAIFFLSTVTSQRESQLLSALTAVNDVLTNVSSVLTNVSAKALSIINTCVNKVNAAFTNVNATAPKFGGGVSLFFRCAAPPHDFILSRRRGRAYRKVFGSYGMMRFK